MARGKAKSKALTMLQGAVSRSKAKTASRGNNGEGNEALDEFERNTEQAIAQAAARLQDRDTALALDPTPEQAYEFARLLRAGVPQPDALCYVLGSVEPGVIELALPRWIRSKAVVDALATLNGGRWPALEPDARLDIALDKHYAEMAHYLYTHDYESADGKEMRKLDSARESLERLRTGRMQENSPFVKFLRDVLKLPAAPVAGQKALTEGDGQGRGDATRPSTMGMVEVEPIVDAEVTETDE